MSGETMIERVVPTDHQRDQARAAALALRAAIADPEALTERGERPTEATRL